MPKRSIKRDEFHLVLIFEAINKIEKYAKDKKYSKYLGDELIFDAISLNLSIIGERVKSLSDSFRKRNPQITYKKIIGMRNFLTHEYHKIQKKIVWETCRDDIPALKKIILENLKKYSDQKHAPKLKNK